jgi:uncharacterized protein
MRDENVAAYLENNPEFFEKYSDMLSGVVIPHPYGGRTISLSERQLLTLREKNKALEKQLYELMENARINDELQAKVHQFTLTLLGAHGTAARIETVIRDLRERFAVPHAALRLWEQEPPSAEVLTFADQTLQPVCAHRPMYDTLSWFGEAGEHLRSFAYLPLRNDEHSTGLLILASEDAQRFYPEMGTLFLQRLAEITTRALEPDQ